MKIEPFKLERYYDKYEFKTKYMLSSSDCEAMTIADLLAFEPDAAEKFQRHWLGYTESPGSAELRQEIARSYQQIEPENVLVHSGSEEPIFSFINVAFNPGDHVIIHYPCYLSVYEVAKAVGCEITRWEGSEADNWELDLEFLRRNIRSNTKAVMINCPHNPTGYLMSREKLQAIVEIARENNLLLFSDEVYRGLEYNGGETLPAACDLYENAVSLGGTAKAMGLPGLRIGWIATRNVEIFKAMAAYKDYLTICNSAPSEFLTIIALRHHKVIIQRNVEIVEANLKLLNPFFERYSSLFSWATPRACSTAFPRLKANVEADKFCVDLIDQKSVLLLPSTCYDYGNKHFRLGFGRKNLPEVLPIFEEFVNNYFNS